MSLTISSASLSSSFAPASTMSSTGATDGVDSQASVDQADGPGGFDHILRHLSDDDGSGDDDRTPVKTSNPTTTSSDATDGRPQVESKDTDDPATRARRAHARRDALDVQQNSPAKASSSGSTATVVTPGALQNAADPSTPLAAGASGPNAGPNASASNAFDDAAAGLAAEGVTPGRLFQNGRGNDANGQPGDPATALDGAATHAPLVKSSVVGRTADAATAAVANAAAGTTAGTAVTATAGASSWRGPAGAGQTSSRVAGGDRGNDGADRANGSDASQSAVASEGRMLQQDANGAGDAPSGDAGAHGKFGADATSGGEASAGSGEPAPVFHVGPTVVSLTSTTITQTGPTATTVSTANDATAAQHIEQDGPGAAMQIVQSMRVLTQSGGGVATVTLDPKYLGGVTLSVKVDQNTVSATVQADSPAVRDWLRSNESTLRQSLGDQGLHLDRLDIAAPSQTPRRDESDSSSSRSPYQPPRQQPPPKPDSDGTNAPFEVIV